MSWKPTGTQSASRTTSVGITALLLFAALVTVPSVAAAPPDTAAYETVDLDNNGQIDAILVTLSNGDALDVDTISKAGWTVSGYTVVDAIQEGRTALANHDNDYALVADPTLEFYLVLDEKTTPDTGETPAVAYKESSGELTAGGVAVADLASADADDQAAPVLMSADGAVDSDEVELVFSEDVGTADLTPGDFGSVGFSIDAVTHDFDGNNADEATLTADDLFVRIDSCTAAVDPSGVVDQNNNLGAVGFEGATTTDIILEGAPCLLQIESNAGDLTVDLTFSENVDGSGAGGALRASDFTGTLQPQILSVSHTAGTSSATATLTTALSIADIGALTLTPKTSVVASSGGGQANQVASTLEDITRPTIIARETIDDDENGLIDRIKITLSELVDSTQPELSTLDTRICNQSGCTTFLYGDDDGTPSSISAAGETDTFYFIFPEEGDGDSFGDTGATPFFALEAVESWVDAGGNGIVPDSSAVQTVDKASPVLREASTVDADNDGKLDAIKARFSETVTLGSDPEDDWDVSGLVESGASVTGATVTITVTEKAGFLTGATPTIDYADAGSSPVEDAAGNDAVDATNFPTTDAAGPVLMSAVWDPSTPTSAKEIELTFSEPVRRSGGGALVKSQITHDAGGAGADSFTFGHTANTDTATLTFTEELGPGDVGVDTVALVLGDIYDSVLNAAPSATPVTLSASDFAISKIEAIDANGNGFLDALDVTFTQDLVDSSFFPADSWTVDTGLNTVFGESGVVQLVNTGDAANDNMIRLLMAETTDFPDTNLPGGVTVDYACGCANTAHEIRNGASTELADEAGITVTDAAPPILLSATTGDVDFDGLIDTYTLAFSETLVGHSATKWAVGGVAATGGTLGDYDHDDNGGTLPITDALLTLTFPESSSFGTGATPQVTYTPGSVKDGSDNLLAAVIADTVTEIDGAGPVIMRASSEVGSTEVELTFSEGAFGSVVDGTLNIGSSTEDDDGNPGTLDDVDADIEYIDAAPDGAARTVTAVSHTAGSATAVVTVSKPFASVNDFGGDRFEVVIAGMIDASVNAAPTVGNLAGLVEGTAADITAPGSAGTVTVVGTPTSTSVTLQWTAPGDDGSSGTVSSYEIRHSTAIITNANYGSATVASATFDPSTLVAGGGTQKATVTGLNPGTTYFFALKGVDEAGNQGGISSSPTATTETADTTAPGNIGTVTPAETANSVTLSFTAPGDDAAAGEVAKYVVKQSSSAITSSGFAAASAATFTADIVAGGQTQDILITGLDQDTTYHFAIQAEDEAGNKNDVKSVGPVTTAKDTTAPTGSLTVTSSTHSEGVGVANRNPAFAWSGLSDAESTITYHYKLDQTEGTTITAATTGTNSGSITTTSVDFSNIATGTWFFHVAGQSAGGFSATETYEVVILETATVVTRAEISAANEDVRDSMDVERDGSDNKVTWSLDGIDPEPSGVQVWRSTSPFSLIATLEGSAATAGEYLDEDAPKDAVYLVTVFYTDDASGGKVDDLDVAPGYAGLSDAEQKDLGTKAADADGFPWWGWLLIALGVLLLILLIVGIIIAARRGGGGGSDDSWNDDSTWDDSGADTWDGGDDAWDEGEETWDSAPAAAAPSNEAHELECPDCNHQFTAHGQRPLKTTCPNCGVKGVLN